MIEHSAPEIIEASVAQLDSKQALIAVSAIQSLIYSLFAWFVGYFAVALCTVALGWSTNP